MGSRRCYYIIWPMSPTNTQPMLADIHIACNHPVSIAPEIAVDIIAHVSDLCPILAGGDVWVRDRAHVLGSRGRFGVRLYGIRST